MIVRKRGVRRSDTAPLPATAEHPYPLMRSNHFGGFVPMEYRYDVPMAVIWWQDARLANKVWDRTGVHYTMCLPDGTEFRLNQTELTQKYLFKRAYKRATGHDPDFGVNESLNFKRMTGCLLSKYRVEFGGDLT